MPAPLFELISELQTLNRRDFPVADESMLNPLSARPLVEGEWLELNGSYQLVRGGDNNAGTADEATQYGVFPVHTERGRYDVQAIKKVNVLYMGMYEAETQIANLTSLAVGSALTVQDVNIGGIVRRGLAVTGSTSGRIIVGYVTRLPGSGRVRFIHMANVKV